MIAVQKSSLGKPEKHGPPGCAEVSKVYNKGFWLQQVGEGRLGAQEPWAARVKKRPDPAGGTRANRNVWSAALSQAKNEGDRLVCANVFGLHWSTRLLAMMECAALSSYLVRQPGKAFPVCRFRERRVRPLCLLIVGNRPGKKIFNSVVVAGL